MNRRDDFIARATIAANFALGLAGALAVSAFVYFFYHYGWLKDRHWSNPYYAFLYYVAPLTVGALLFASLRQRARYKLNLVVLLVATTASVYASELCIEILPVSRFAPAKGAMTVLNGSRNKQEDAEVLKKQWGVTIDTRSAGAFITALQQRSIDAVPIITPPNQLFIDQPDGSLKSAITIDGQELVPLAAVSNRTTVFCNESGQWQWYQSDARGFNNDNGIWRNDRLDVAALGDSYTHGYCVARDRNFVALIRQRYARTLNAGIAGNGPLLMLATLKEYLPRYAPRVVLWFYYEGNDLVDLQRERRSALVMKYLQDGFSQPALSRQADIDQAILAQIPRLRALEDRLRSVREANQRPVQAVMSFARLSMLRDRLGLVGSVDAEESTMSDFRGANMAMLRQVLGQAKTQTEQWGGRLYFVYLPEWARYTRYSSLGKSARDQVLSLVQGLAIPIIDIVPVFEAHGDPLSLFPFRQSGHYNEAGHQLVANEVLRSLTYGD